MELQIEGLELLEEKESLEERECDGDKMKDEVDEIPVVDEKEVEIEKTEESIQNVEKENPLLFNIEDDNDTYGTFVIYIVRQNESIREIIERYPTSLEEVEKYNDLKDIGIGSKLIIPLLHD